MLGKKYDACESAGAYWVCMDANRYADKVSVNRRTLVSLDFDSKNQQRTKVVIYENISSEKAAYIINLPSLAEILDPYLYGFADRYSAYVVARLMHHGCCEFRSTEGKMAFEPESFISKKQKND